MKNNIKKIGIITLNGYENYGNRSQNYATQEVIKSLGFNVETIIVKDTPSNGNKNSIIIKKLQKMATMTVNEICTKINKKINYYMNKNAIDERIKIFKSFSKKYILEENYYIINNNLADLSNRYDFFITGSDQVWNPLYINRSPIYFLTFTRKNKRIAYAPSFGISDIPIEYEGKYKVWLSEMHRLSVREDAGAKIIKSLTRQDAPVLVDPTLMLTKEKWLSISKEPAKKSKSRYLLTYFLGGIPNEYQSKIRTIAKENKLKIINLADLRDRETYQTGPSEFIDYVNSASVFCTDSFHGAVFSILLEIPFIVFDRKSNSPSMYSRIDTLLTTFELNSRKANNITTNEQVFQVDYSHIPPILETERKKALDYLKEALNV